MEELYKSPVSSQDEDCHSKALSENVNDRTDSLLFDNV